jgi:D-glycero-D-manno-heptose 1,7-bisphosphate phosphatase
VFLDRDGTLIEERHYLADPALVSLLPGSAEGLKRLRAAGFACVVVSNQSAVGRGVLTVEGLKAIEREICRRLTEVGTMVDGWYYCPEVPRTADRTTIDHPDRKPGPGMLLRAARDLNLDLGASWMIGDMVSDLLAGRHAGCRGSILVRTGYGGPCDDAGLAAYVAGSLEQAAAWILERSELPAGGRAEGAH